MIGSGSVGIAAPFRRLKIVDSAGIEVAQGEVGELWVSGPGMFGGHNNRPEVSAEVLSGGWMRTGDLFRCDEAGYYYVVGRLKDMVRRNMENISTHEVEQVLIGHPGVAHAAVLAVPDAKNGEEVLALVVLREGADQDEVSPELLRDHCASRLAKFKLPRYVGYRESFPITPSGKVAKGQLRTDSADPKAGCYDLATASWVRDDS
jgi:acyl-CoA synthetase (AMP-forming)/AMP-acid ligase II